MPLLALVERKSKLLGTQGRACRRLLLSKPRNKLATIDEHALGHEIGQLGKDAPLVGELGLGRLAPPRATPRLRHSREEELRHVDVDGSLARARVSFSSYVSL